MCPALAGNFWSGGRQRGASRSFKKWQISFSNINKQYGKQLLFVDASFQLNPGNKVGLAEQDNAIKTTLFCSGVPVVLAGDYNVVPTLQDIYPTRSLDNNALIQPESRQAFARLLAQAWTDAMRKLHPDGPLWTFWDYKFEPWQKDKMHATRSLSALTEFV